MMYTNRNIIYIPNGEITEWDIKSGNTSILEYFNLVPKTFIEKLRKMTKGERLKAVGLYQRKHPEIKKSLEDGFNQIVNQFIMDNQLDTDDIISIKRDAVFIYLKNPTITSYGNSIKFVKKNVYKAYIAINGIECYMKFDKSFDLKGIPDEYIKYHQEGMLQFFRDCIELSTDLQGLLKYLKEYVSAYKQLELPLDAYREFNAQSGYSYHQEEFASYRSDIDVSEIAKTNIGYNYTKIILPFIRMCR